VTTSAPLGLSVDDTSAFNDALQVAAYDGALDAGLEGSNNAATVLSVEITWSDDKHIDYSGTIRVLDETSPLASRDFTCSLCGVGAVLDRVRHEASLILSDIEWPSPSSPTSNQAEPLTVPKEPAPATSSAAPAALSSLGWSGIAVGALGLGATITGATLWARGDARRASSNPENASLVNVTTVPFRSVGIGMVIGGAAALMTGGTLLAIGIARNRRDRKRVAYSPWVVPGLAGITATGRF